MASSDRDCSIENGEIPRSASDNGDGESGGSGGGFNPSSREQEIDGMLRRLRKLEELEREMLPVAAAASYENPDAAAIACDKADVDARSIYVGNVDYECLPEEVQQHFQECGTVNRVTILTDYNGHPKGYAYVEFLEIEAVQNALQLNDTELHDRRLKVCQKRTNIPGMRHLSIFQSLLSNIWTKVQEVIRVLALLVILPGCCDFSFLLGNFHDIYRR